MRQSYRLEKTRLNDKWDDFVKRSENGTIFSCSDYLGSVNANIVPYYVSNEKELRAAVLVIEAEDRKSLCLHDFIIYNGIIFGDSTHNQNHSQVISEKFRVSEFIAEQLIAEYGKVTIALHPTFIDVRPFLWVNYGTALPKYNLNVKYTTYVSIEDFCGAKKLEDIAIYNKASKSRRQEIRYAIRKNVLTKEEFDADLFVDFYGLTMKRQNINVAGRVLDEMKVLIANLVKCGLGRMFVSCTKNGEPGSMAFYGIDNKRAYYIFGANNPELRDSHVGSAVVWDSFYELSKSGIKEVDLEGVNSPKRGWFKLSFGGDLIPYYQLSFNGQE